MKFVILVQFELDHQGQATPKTTEILNKVFCIFCPNNVVIVSISDELPRGQTKNCVNSNRKRIGKHGSFYLLPLGLYDYVVKHIRTSPGKQCWNHIKTPQCYTSLENPTNANAIWICLGYLHKGPYSILHQCFPFSHTDYPRTSFHMLLCTPCKNLWMKICMQFLWDDIASNMFC